MILSEYRASLDNILATATDAATWPDAIFDEALRLALDDFNPLLAYEVDFSVSMTGYTQDLSTITDINQVVACAYPWVDGGNFGLLLVEWRLSGLHSVYFTGVQPTSGQKIRVRYTKAHKIDDLDSAATTTVPTRAERLLLMAAAAWCCVLRQRQITENPALPTAAGVQLGELAAGFRARFNELVQQLPPVGEEQWGQG